MSETIGNRAELVEFEEHATAIGYVCLQLAALESLLDRCIWVGLDLQNAKAMDCIAANCDLSQKTRMLKGLAFLNKPSDDWFDRVRSTLDGIKVLQERRNRIVHDEWIPTPEGYERARKRVAFKKAQSFQPLKLLTYEAVPIKAADIWRLVDDIDEASNALFSIFTEAFGLVLDPRPDS